MANVADPLQWSPQGVLDAEKLQEWDRFFAGEEEEHPFLTEYWHKWKNVGMYDQGDGDIPQRVVEAFEDFRGRCIERKATLPNLAPTTVEEMQKAFRTLNIHLTARITTESLIILRGYFASRQDFSDVPEDPKELVLYLKHNEKITEIEELNLSQKAIEWLPVGFTQLPFNKLWKVRLDGRPEGNRNLLALPPAHKLFPHSRIVHFSASDNAIRRIPKDFGSWWNLAHLDLSGNKIETLPLLAGKTFETINFSRNRIETVHKDFGKGWGKCRRIDLRANPFQSKEIHALLKPNFPPKCEILV